ncbi:hypothetical protein [Proteiniphilum sp. UBA5384]|uniref:hypothetical protein n=1 Tax=Proteiniphilum sp. UBA5384 TaxID=1947279 RepID=UPI0025D84FD3|nr:hypothetical protein [Proteiniphilum sp. UBA5384]
MKPIKYILWIVAATLLLLGSVTCSSDIDEVPPRTNNEFKQYVLPKESRLTAEERDYIEQRMNEYEDATK